MLLVLKFKRGDLALGVSCLLMFHPEISICKLCLTVRAKEKAQMCLNSQGLWMHVLSLCLREAVDGGVLPPWAENDSCCCCCYFLPWRENLQQKHNNRMIYAIYSTVIRKCFRFITQKNTFQPLIRHHMWNGHDFTWNLYKRNQMYLIAICIWLQ